MAWLGVAVLPVRRDAPVDFAWFSLKIKIMMTRAKRLQLRSGLLHAGM